MYSAAVKRSVEEPGDGMVVLPEPAAHERDVRPGEIERRPVIDRVHRLHAVARLQVRPQVADRGGPHLRVGRAVGGAARPAARQREDVPGRRERDRRHHDRQRPPAPQRRDEQRERQGEEAHPRDVVAEPGRDHVDRDHSEQVGGQHSAQAPRAIEPPGQREQDDAEGGSLDRLAGGERQGAHRKQVQRDQLGRRRKRDRRAPARRRAAVEDRGGDRLRLRPAPPRAGRTPPGSRPG